MNKKYSKLYANKFKKKPGPKGPSRALLKFVVETKEKNPRNGSPKIAFLANQVLKDEEVNEPCLAPLIKDKNYGLSIF